MESLLKKVNELYGLNVVSLEKVTKGCLSENHVLIGDKNKFFLKNAKVLIMLILLIYSKQLRHNWIEKILLINC